ncbi:MAG: spore germination protein [Clostridiales bacterium]|nr:spore germination protein [Clostridiales bacterium]
MSKPVFQDSYQKNVEYFDKLFGIGTNYDFISREQLIAGHSARFYFIDSFVNSQILERLFIYLAELKNISSAEDVQRFAAAHLPYTEVSVESDADKFVYQIMSGTMGMLLDDFENNKSTGFVGIILDVRSYPTRGIDQSENDRVLRGAHDSFVETIKQNSTLIRRRIRDPRLTFERITVGDVSKSDIVISYIEGEADADYVNSLKNKISSIKVDALTLGQESLAECLIKRRWYNPFPKFRYTERPDTAAAHLLEGGVIILCDTSPEAMILPTCIFDFMQETDDYYFPPLTGSYLRLLRYIVFILTLLLTPTWYLLISHPDWIPEWMSFILIDTEYNLPIIAQLFIIEFALDGLKLASMNTPSSLNNTFGVVGGLILGDFAVQIGWFIPEVIVYMAFVAIANFSQSSYELGYAFKFMRMLLLLTTAIFGIWGYIGGIIIVILLAATNKTVNGKRNYLYPLIPFNGRALKRLVVRERLRTHSSDKESQH